VSQYYDMGNKTLWNPSNGASRLFLGQLAAFEAELRLPSGIGPMENDECEIDPARFDLFVNSLLAHHRRTQHAVMRALTEGFVTTVLALAGRAGVDVQWDENEDAWADQLREKAQQLARSMTY
jgi:hypothetical protein